MGCCLPVAVAVAERFAALGPAVVPALAEDCWVPFGWVAVATEIAVLPGAPAVLAVAPADGGTAVRGGMCVRNGIIA